MRLVLDTNVVISAFLNPEGTPSQVLKLVLQGKAELIVNSKILTEYEKVMSRPKFSKYIDAKLPGRFISIIKNIGVLFDPIPGNIKLFDESDRIFYDTAKNSNSILVSGNIKHFPKEPFIMLPGDFIRHLHDSIK